MRVLCVRTRPFLEFQHNLSGCLASVLFVRILGKYPCGNTKVWHWHGVTLHDACFGNLPDFPVPGASFICTYLVQLSPQPRKMHLNWSQPLLFDWLICDAYCFGIVTTCWGFWLWVSCECTLAGRGSWCTLTIGTAGCNLTIKAARFTLTVWAARCGLVKAGGVLELCSWGTRSTRSWLGCCAPLWLIHGAKLYELIHCWSIFVYEFIYSMN